MASGVCSPSVRVEGLESQEPDRHQQHLRSGHGDAHGRGPGAVGVHAASGDAEEAADRLLLRCVRGCVSCPCARERNRRR